MDSCTLLSLKIDICPVIWSTAAVDGNWGAWSSPSPCSATCGQGLSMKVRFCDSPAPSNGGQPCSGDASVASTCSMPACSSSDTYGANYVNVSKHRDSVSYVRPFYIRMTELIIISDSLSLQCMFNLLGLRACLRFRFNILLKTCILICNGSH